MTYIIKGDLLDCPYVTRARSSDNSHLHAAESETPVAALPIKLDASAVQIRR